MEDDYYPFTTESGITLAATYKPGTTATGIIYLCGSSGSRHYVQHLADPLVELHRWTFDLHGQGSSGGTFDPRQMVEDFTEAAFTLRKRHGLRRMGGFGQSMGGMVIGIIAGQEDSPLDFLCTTSAPNDPNNVSLLPFYFYYPMRYLGYRPLTDIGAPIVERLIGFPREVPDLNGYRGPRFHTMKLHNLRQLMKAVRESPRLDDHVQGIEQPYLGIWGRQDRLLFKGEFPEEYREMIRRIPAEETSITVYDELDHSLSPPEKRSSIFMEHAPAYVEEEILAFLTRYA